MLLRRRSARPPGRRPDHRRSTRLRGRGAAPPFHSTPDRHSPADDLSNVDLTALGINSQATAFATLSLAQDPTPLDLADNHPGKGKGKGKGKGHDRGDGVAA